jgi:uncharacterized repeat protein (TIGR02543 family)
VKLTTIPYDITYVMNGGTAGEGHFTTYTTDKDHTLVAATREGYVFAGWYDNSSLTGNPIATITKGTIGEKAFYARWKKALSNTDISVEGLADQTYTGSAFTPAVTVKDGETDITNLCNVSYDNNTNAGTATVTISLKTASEIYGGEATKTFKINPKTVSTPTITLSATEYVYDGQAKEPAVSSVKVGDTVIPASEYTVAYENNTNAGTATVKIVDKDGGNYTVSGSATFDIFHKSDTNRDKKVDAADIVRLVNDKAPKSDIDAVVKIIMQNK